MCLQAFSGYYAIVKDLNLTNNPSLDNLQAKTMNVCKMSWSEVTNALFIYYYYDLFIYSIHFIRSSEEVCVV